MIGVVDAIKCLQRRTILLNPSQPPEELPGPTHDEKWRWRAKAHCRLNDQQELEYADRDRKKGWRKAIVSNGLFRVISEAHCKAVMHPGQDKTVKEVVQSESREH